MGNENTVHLQPARNQDSGSRIPLEKIIAWEGVDVNKEIWRVQGERI
jgi:hypothetical protein